MIVVWCPGSMAARIRIPRPSSPSSRTARNSGTPYEVSWHSIRMDGEKTASLKCGLVVCLMTFVAASVATSSPTWGSTFACS